MSLIVRIKKLFTDILQTSDNKILFLDISTKTRLYDIFTQSELLNFHILGVEMLIKRSSPIIKQRLNTKCICMFNTNDTTNIEVICSELCNPKYSEYHIYFTNLVDKRIIDLIAVSDKYNSVKSIHQCYFDFCICSDYAFTSKNNKLTNFLKFLGSDVIIQYDNISNECKQLANQINITSQQTSSATLLLLLDRRSDPITPLLQSWFYSSIYQGNIFTDTFYKNNMYTDWGTITQIVSEMSRKMKTIIEQKDGKNLSVKELKEMTLKINSINKDKKTLETHITILTEFKKKIEDNKLYQISELEQKIVCDNEPINCANEILNLLNKNEIKPEYIKRLVILYVLKHGDKLLKDKISIEYLESAKKIKDVYDIYKKKDVIWDLISSYLNKGENNKYMRWQPPLKHILDNIRKLNLTSYPYVKTPNDTSQRLSRIVVYIIGGITVDECYLVEQFNKNNKMSINVYIGGDLLLNNFEGISI